MPDDVQPDEGQGGEAAGTPTALESYLQTVPEDQRSHVEPYLRDAEKNVNGRLQEAAEFRKTWEPFTEVEALAQYDPESLSQLLAWHQQIAASPEAMQQWLAQTAKEMGLTLDGEETAPETGEDLSQEKIQELIAQQAEQQVAPLQQRLEAFEAQQAVVSEESAIRQQFDVLEAENSIQLTEQQKQVICDLGLALAADDKGQPLPMGDASWVTKGFDRFREIVSEGQRAFVDDKMGQPKLPLSTGGQPAATPPKTFKEASAQGLERLRQQS